jgi:DNA-directed RNA polymerase specialized sigma24 family protein
MSLRPDEGMMGAMEETEWLAERFEQHRSRLRAAAYRMLGSMACRRSRRGGRGQALPWPARQAAAAGVGR